MTLVQDCLLSTRLAGVPAGGPWLPWPGARPVSGVAVSGSLASPAGEPGPCLEWFRCQQPIPSLGWPSVGPWLPWRGARRQVPRRRRGPCSRVLGAAMCEPYAMCVRRRVHDSFQSSFSPHKIFILVVQGPVIAISHPELFIPCTD